MTLIAMAVHDTDDNKRTALTVKTLASITKTVDFEKHRLFVIDNDSCMESKAAVSAVIRRLQAIYGEKSATLIGNSGNIGTAEAINLAWKEREPGEFCIKMDNDVVIHQMNWIEQMEEAIKREPMIGIIGLKRKDLWERPDHENPDFRSELMMLPHETGQPWIVVEKVKHVIGTCQMYNPELLDQIGYLYQPGVYGFDDVLAAYRCDIAGFHSVFLPHILIDHIDPGGDDYCHWKERQVKEVGQQVMDIVAQYKSGARSIFYKPINFK